MKYEAKIYINNYNILKCLSIYVVVFAHFLCERFPLLWVPTTMSLIIFTYMSGYYSYLKYSSNFVNKNYWANKFERLFFNYITIMIFLFILFIFQDKKHILTWHTIVNVLGLNGILNWLKIQNNSPYGAGMWFFTLLLFFYILFPLILHLNKTKKKSIISFLLITILLLYLSNKVVFGHSLWLTINGYFLGIFVAKNRIQIPRLISIVLLIITSSLFIILNMVYNINEINNIVIITIAFLVIQTTVYIKVNELIYKIMTLNKGFILEIYLIHSYIYFRYTDNLYLNLMISFVSIILLSYLLYNISNSVKMKLIND